MAEVRSVKKRPLKKKILMTIIILVLATLFVMSLVFGIMIFNLVRTTRDASEQMGNKAEEQSAVVMVTRTQERLSELAVDKANLADEMFVEFENAVVAAADAAGRVYDNADNLPLRAIPRPDAADDGKLSVQLLYSVSADPSSADIQREVGLLGNMQDTLLAINNSHENMISNYFATETGIMVQADYIAADKFADDGSILPYEAKERPWYEGASSTGKPFFTSVSKDVHTSGIGIMCGVPVYHDGALMGVAGAGMYLDNLAALVESVDLGEGGNAFIVNQNGQVLFSTYSDGELAAAVDGIDLRTSESEGISMMAADILTGESGTGLLDEDDDGEELSYVAYAPMETVGWFFVIVFSCDEVEAPTQQLVDDLNQLTQQAISTVHDYNRHASFLLLFSIATLIVVVLFASTSLSSQIVSPIISLTDKVGDLKGDNLDFEWDIDTGDEIQVLAGSFSSLTQRMKEYIINIQAITAERERIGAELNVATKIQADMLPCIFPPFPDRNDFDIYASMTPAKEVGGDFYDFFLLDQDHLVMVIADVSGKGVPAALFMVISKTLIKDQAQMDSSPKAILEKVNSMLCENNAEGMFVTVWLGIMEISTGKIVAANAGHEYPAVRKADGTFELLMDKHGLVMGAMDGISYTEYEMQIDDGGCLFVYTDGVPEATNADNQLFGTDRLLDVLNKEPLVGSEQLLRNVKASVDEFVGDAPQFDDLTMLALIRK